MSPAHNDRMALLSDLVALRERIAASPGRLEKRRLVAEYLRALAPDELPSPRPPPLRPVLPTKGLLPNKAGREGSDKVLAVPLAESDYETLKDIAERHELSIGELVREMISGHLRYR